MNKKQLSVMWVGIALVILTLLFPPWRAYKEVLPENVIESQREPARHKKVLDFNTIIATEDLNDIDKEPARQKSGQEDDMWKPSSAVEVNDWKPASADLVTNIPIASKSDVIEVLRIDYASIFKAPYVIEIGSYKTPYTYIAQERVGGYIESLHYVVYRVHYYCFITQLIIIIILTGGLILTFGDKNKSKERHRVAVGGEELK